MRYDYTVEESKNKSRRIRRNATKYRLKLKKKYKIDKSDVATDKQLGLGGCSCSSSFQSGICQWCHDKWSGK